MWYNIGQPLSNVFLFADICHLVLDLYSNVPQNHEDSPPPSKPQLQPQQRASAKRQRQVSRV